MWASIKQVKFTFEQSELIFLKYNYEDVLVSILEQLHQKPETQNKLVKNENCLYEKPVGILKKKNDDLTKRLHLETSSWLP